MTVRSDIHGGRATRLGRHRGFALAVGLSVGFCAPVFAQGSDGGDGSDTTARLIELLVKKGVLTRGQASDLLTEARDEKHQARGVRRPGTAKDELSQAAATEPEPPKGTVRVTYVPKAVREQIAADVKQQVLAQTQAEGWAKPNEIPGWTQRIRITGDVRVRGERTFFDHGNYSTFPDYRAINALSNGYDASGGTTAPPLLNTTEDRTLYRLRARLGVEADVTDWLSADIRVATGNDSQPVSLNQTLGQPGDFSKYSLWLDRAYISFHPDKDLIVDVGRAPNPFWTTNLLFSDALGFDGLSVRTRHDFGKDWGVFLNAGAFPVYNTDFNFGTAANAAPQQASGTQLPSHDAYLFAAQTGADWKINSNYAVKGAAGFFDFYNVQGGLSSPCVAPTAYGSCNTDNQRTPYVQFGNTLFPLRAIATDPSNPTSTASPQFYGLASRFDVLDLHGSVTLRNFSPIDVVVDADYLKNLGFNRAKVAAKGPTNNLGSGTSAPYVGGDSGYEVAVTVGHQQLDRLWDWNVGAAYKYLESDAVLDALTDSDFHLGGTNAKGYIINGNLGLTKNAWLSASWLSASQISGPPYAVDVLLVDLNAKF